MKFSFSTENLRAKWVKSFDYEIKISFILSNKAKGTLKTGCRGVQIVQSYIKTWKFWLFAFPGQTVKIIYRTKINYLLIVEPKDSFVELKETILEPKETILEPQETVVESKHTKLESKENNQKLNCSCYTWKIWRGGFCLNICPLGKK